MSRGSLLNSLQEVALLRVVAVVEQLSNVLTHTGCERLSVRATKRRAVLGVNHTDGDLGHFDRLPLEFLRKVWFFASLARKLRNLELLRDGNLERQGVFMCVWMAGQVWELWR
jgi:hypothetical protein